MSRDAAWCDVATRKAWRRFVLRSLALVVSGVFGFVVAAVVLTVTDPPDSGILTYVCIVIFGLSLVPFIGGILA